MGTLTVNISDEIENSFRKEAKEHVGQEKGALGKAVMEAFQLWVNQKRQEDIVKELREGMQKGYKLGKRKFKHRSELYERN